MEQWGWRPSFLGKRSSADPAAGRLGKAPRKALASKAARKSAPATRSFICKLDGEPDDASCECSVSSSSRYTASARARCSRPPALPTPCPPPEQRRRDHQSCPQLGTALFLPRAQGHQHQRRMAFARNYCCNPQQPRGCRYRAPRWAGRASIHEHVPTSRALCERDLVF